MTFRFDAEKGCFEPEINPEAKIQAITIGGTRTETKSWRDAFLAMMIELYSKRKWDVREVMVKKHGFLQPYFYQDIKSSNKLMVSEGIFMKEISQDRAYDLLLKTAVHFKPTDLKLEAQ